MITISQLQDLINNEITLVVEGKKDKEVLRKIGFKKVFDISGKSFEEIIRELKYREVAILTDFDEEGEEKAKLLVKFFNSYGIKVDFSLRKKFKKLLIKKIEELKFFLKFFEGYYYGENCSIYDKIFNRSRIFMRRNSGEARCNRCNFWSDRRFARS